MHIDSSDGFSGNLGMFAYQRQKTNLSMDVHGAYIDEKSLNTNTCPGSGFFVFLFQLDSGLLHSGIFSKSGLNESVAIFSMISSFEKLLNSS